MLVSNPPVNSHQLTNSLTTSNTLHSSLPTSFSMSSLAPLSTTNPCTWTTKQVEEWLIKHDLNDCVDLICHQHRMNGQRLMNLKEDYVLQLTGTNKNNELWLQIKKLQQYYSSTYHLWTQRQSTSQQQQQQFQQSLPMTASSYFSPSPLQAPMQLRPIQPLRQIRPTSPSVTLPLSSSSSSIPLTQSQSSSTTTIQLDENQEQQSQRQNNPSLSVPTNQTQTAIHFERSPLTENRLTNNHRRASSHSLSTSGTSINILPPPSPPSPRATNALLYPHRTPADQIEDQPITGCCFVGSIRSDRKKTLSACLLALCTVYFCSFIITIVDERLPDPRDFPPLPDLILDNIKQIPWAFSVTEKIIIIEVVTLISVIALHRHR
jgi:hypothetical protein